MTAATLESDFPRGLLRAELFVGVTASVTARTVGVNLSDAGRVSGSHFAGARYGRGEVGEFVLIEGQRSLLLGRIAEVRLREPERRSLTRSFSGSSELDAIGEIQLLGSVAMDSLQVTAGIDSYPRLGDRVYAAPHPFIALLPRLMESRDPEKKVVELTLGSVDFAQESPVSIMPERLFGRHCAVLGATGGGKSWTTAKIIEECLKSSAKLILIDATGEYRNLSGQYVRHCHLGEPAAIAANSTASSLPPTSFVESDFVALFEPAGKVQGPKMRAAIRSLRLAKLNPALATNGVIRKHDQPKQPVVDAETDPRLAAKLDDPRQPFDVTKLVQQIEQECVWPNGGSQRSPDNSRWGGPDDASYSNCLALFARISGILTSPAFECVFGAHQKPSLTKSIDEFSISDSHRLLRICLSGISYEYGAREIIANVIGRYLLAQARSGIFKARPVVVFVDEAHNFVGKHVGAEDYQARLDAFEIIAKEGRKYGLVLCLASQRARDVTEGVLSQMGTLVVHRLTNDRDREVVERACGEIDRAASAFLPNLRPGEAAIIGADFPIPLTIQVCPPITKPESDGPAFQTYWGRV